MTTWAGRILAGLAATASLVGAVGAAGALGAWWMPVFAVSLVGTGAGAAAWLRPIRPPDTELSGLAAALDGRTWARPDVAHPAA